MKAISADGQVVEDTIDINLANSGRYVDWAIHPGTNPSNFRPLSGAITYNSFTSPPKAHPALPDGPGLQVEPSGLQRQGDQRRPLQRRRPLFGFSSPPPSSVVVRKGRLVSIAL